MRRKAVWLIGMGVLVLTPVASASAQEVDVLPLPLVEVSAGYAYMRDTTMEENFPKGWYFSAGTNLTSWFGLTGEVTGAHKRFAAVPEVPDFSIRTNLYTFMGGPRFFVKRGRVVPFAQVLAGAAHLRWNARVSGIDLDELGEMDVDFGDTQTEFAIQPGGGLSFLLTRNLGLRAAVDYRRIMFSAGDEDNSEIRGIGGVVFGWGAR